MVTISLCMIVKNEERVLGRCLESVQEIADEIIIVDTGSEDRTKEIAEKYHARVFEQEWQDDFSRARNYSFSHAEMDYCMWLDADDIITKSEALKLKRWKEETDESSDVIMLRYVAGFDEKRNPTLVYYRERIVKRDKDFQWQGRVHEAIAVRGRTEYLDCEIEHHSIKTEYSRRNLEIYKKMESDGEVLSARDRFYYGRELFYHRECVEAVDNLLKFLQLPEGFVENQCYGYIPCIQLSVCWYYLDDIEKAFQYHCRAGMYKPYGREFLKNQQYFISVRQ